MITDICETCTPCEGCQYEDQDAEECEFCDPYNSTRICSYCGNGFCRCDAIEGGYEGPMHADCLEQFINRAKRDYVEPSIKPSIE
jgi:hypothetical protein